MTCVSPRSGSASRRTRTSDHHPIAAAPIVSATTAARCFADRSMMRLIMAVDARRSARPHAALGVEEKRARHHNPLAGRDAFENLDAAARTAADLHPTGLEQAGAPLD